MSVKFNRITPEEIKELITSRFNEEWEFQHRHKAIANVLEEWHGKLISKRLATAIEKAYPQYNARLVTSYGLLQIEICDASLPWGDKYDDKTTHLVGYTDRGKRVDCEKFEEWDACHGSASKERNKARLGYLKVYPNTWSRCAEIANLSNKMLEVHNELKQYLEAGNPDASEIECKIGLIN